MDSWLALFTNLRDLLKVNILILIRVRIGVIGSVPAKFRALHMLSFNCKERPFVVIKSLIVPQILIDLEFRREIALLSLFASSEQFPHFTEVDASLSLATSFPHLSAVAKGSIEHDAIVLVGFLLHFLTRG